MPNFCRRQGFEENDFVYPIEKLGTNRLPEHLEQFYTKVIHQSVTIFFRERFQSLLDEVRTKVRRHDHNRIFEIDRPAFAVRQPTLIEKLEENVEDLGVGLFDFVQ